MAPANHIQTAASWLATAAQPTKWYGQRQRRNDLPAQLAPNSFVVNSNFSEAWVNSAGRSNISSIFQHGLQDGYLSLTRAPLGYFYNAPHWGGLFRAPPLISETTGPILKIQAAFESPGKTVEGKQILLTSGSRVTSQVRSKSKCSTYRAWWHRRAKLRC